jgi:hypothetical protein
MSRLRTLVAGGPVVTDGDRRLAVLRILVCGYATVWTTVRIPHLLDTIGLESRRLDPVGPLAWLDDPLPAAVLIVAVLVTPLAGIAAMLGWRYRISAPTLALSFLLLTTYRNSWGQIFHTENLVSLHLVVLAVAPADRWWSVGGRTVPSPGASGRADASRRLPDGNGGSASRAVEAMAVMTVCTYFVAGVAKLRVAGWAWVDGDVILHQVSFDNARKDLLGDTSSPLAAVLVENAWLTAPAAWASMIIELGAPIVLLGARLARWWAAAAWLFHVAILALMAILFPYHLLGIAMAPLLPVERLADRVHSRVTDRRVQSGSGQAVPSSATPPMGAP